MSPARWTCRGPSAGSSWPGTAPAGPAGLLRLAAAAGWPVLAEPSSGARQGPHALGAYQYLLEHPAFLAATPS